MWGVFMKKNSTGFPSIDLTHDEGISYFKRKPFIPNLNIFNAVEMLSLFYRGSFAVDSLELRVTFQELIDDSVRLSKSFKELGVKADEIITVSMPNLYQALVVFLAANRIGATITFLNSFAGSDEICHYINEFESKIYINFDKNNEYNNDIFKKSCAKTIITLERNEVNKRTFNDKKSYGYSDTISYEEFSGLSKFQKGMNIPALSSNHNALILFTSGTTGAPKSVVLTNKNIIAAAVYLKNTSSAGNKVGEKSLVCVPFTYPYGFSTSTLMSLMCGREVILAPDLSLETIPVYYGKKPNIIFGSPAFLDLTMRAIPDGYDLSSANTFISGGDFLTVKKTNEGKDFFSKHGSKIEICNGSGNAETVSCGTNSYGLPIKPETAGRVLYGTSNIIIDSDTGKELKYGEEGMLCVSGKHVFKEYYKNPEKTAESKFMYKGKEYFETGTRGILHEDGYFELTGRDSRFYIIKTLNKVYCDRVQNIITGIDIVSECAVVKVPDKDMLYVNKAYIVLKPGVEQNEDVKEYIKECCKGVIKMAGTQDEAQLKSYEIPVYIEFVDELPRKKSEKIDYDFLEKDAEKKLVKK